MSIGLVHPSPLNYQLNLTTWGIYSLGYQGNFAAMSSQSWPAANRAIFIPFRFPWPFRASGVGFVNGGTVSGNVDVGMYSADGRRIVSSGSVAQSGPNGFQFFSFAGGPNQRFEPGLYYVAVAFSGSGTISGTAAFGSTKLRVLGLAQMGSAFPLPAAATFESISSTLFPPVMLGAAAMPQYSPAFNEPLPPLPHIIPWSLESGGLEFSSRGAFSFRGAPSQAWPTANKAILVTFSIFKRTRFQRMFIMNGNTASGNFDIGVYDHSLRKIVASGSTAQSGGNTIQAVSLDFTLDPGNYYMALAMNNTSGSVWGGVVDSSSQLGFNNSIYRAVTSSFPLPDTLGSPNDFSVFIPAMGLSQRTVI
jgi:hypothetical protein